MVIPGTLAVPPGKIWILFPESFIVGEEWNVSARGAVVQSYRFHFCDFSQVFWGMEILNLYKWDVGMYTFIGAN